HASTRAHARIRRVPHISGRGRVVGPAKPIGSISTHVRRTHIRITPFILAALVLHSGERVQDASDPREGPRPLLLVFSARRPPLSPVMRMTGTYRRRSSCPQHRHVPRICPPG